jgi:hypothetical protein
MRDPLQGVLLSEREKAITVMSEEGTSLLTGVVELLSIPPAELVGFVDRERIIVPLAEILGQVWIDILVQVEADLAHYVGSALSFPRLWTTKRSVAESYRRLKNSPRGSWAATASSPRFFSISPSISV